MARVMSLVMSIFIFVPIVAPSIGQLVLFVASWRAIFVGFLAIAVLAGLWLHVRQAETLLPARRRPMRVAALVRAAVTVVTHPITMGYTLATGFIFGAFVSYLGMSQQIFAEQYDQGKLFAVYFGVLAVAIGLASIVNARLVLRFGMRNLTKLALRSAVVFSVVFLAYCFSTDGHPPLWTFMIYMFATFFFNGILFGNYNAMAMEPMGAIAGMAASVIGTLTSLVALVSGAIIAQLYDGTLMPLVGGFAVLGLGALCATESAEALKERR
jgi:DHA1 family bicyclomycin/chloramphenicol resistance-like MFS transporter